MARLNHKSGIHITFHQHRRAFATWALRGGMDLISLQGLLGHKSVRMVRRYALIDASGLRAAQERTMPIDSLMQFRLN